MRSLRRQRPAAVAIRRWAAGVEGDPARACVKGARARPPASPPGVRAAAGSPSPCAQEASAGPHRCGCPWRVGGVSLLSSIQQKFRPSCESPCG